MEQSDAAWQMQTESAEQTRALGRKLGARLLPGDVVALHGTLGAGKTVLTQGIAQGLGIARLVTSPTFILVNEYALPDKDSVLYHMDAYRFENAPAEALEIGLAEMMDGYGILVVEWATRVADLLPEDSLFVEIEVAGQHTRQIRLRGQGPRSRALAAGVAEAERATV